MASLRFLVATIALLTVASSAQAKEASSSSAKSGAYGLGLTGRFSLLYGAVSYSDTSPLTNDTLQISGNQLGYRLGLDYWPKAFGFEFNLASTPSDVSQSGTSQLNGARITQLAASVDFGWRLRSTPKRSTAAPNELALLAGPAIMRFADARAYAGQNFYDLVPVSVFGAQAKIRGAIAVAADWGLELSAFRVLPLSTVQAPSGATVDNATTLSQGGEVDLVYHDPSGFQVGLGYVYEHNHLEYGVKSALNPQTVDFNVNAAAIFLGLSL